MTATPRATAGRHERAQTDADRGGRPELGPDDG